MRGRVARGRPTVMPASPTVPDDRNTTTRRFLFAMVLVLGLVILHVVNHLRLDAGMLGANAERLVAEARALRDHAKPEYQEVALASLPPNPLTGEHHRLDELMDSAVATRAPPPLGRPAVIAALEFDNPARPELAAAQGGPVAHGDGC